MTDPSRLPPERPRRPKSPEDFSHTEEGHQVKHEHSCLPEKVHEELQNAKISIAGSLQRATKARGVFRWGLHPSGEPWDEKPIKRAESWRITKVEVIAFERKKVKNHGHDMFTNHWAMILHGQPIRQFEEGILWADDLIDRIALIVRPDVLQDKAPETFMRLFVEAIPHIGEECQDDLRRYMPKNRLKEYTIALYQIVEILEGYAISRFSFLTTQSNKNAFTLKYLEDLLNEGFVSGQTVKELGMEGYQWLHYTFVRECVGCRHWLYLLLKVLQERNLISQVSEEVDDKGVPLSTHKDCCMDSVWDKSPRTGRPEKIEKGFTMAKDVGGAFTQPDSEKKNFLIEDDSQRR